MAPERLIQYDPMMKLLALDTSTEYCSAALCIDGEIDEREARVGQRHSQILLGMLDELLRLRRMRVSDLDAIAFGEGPGSFTGLRIACGVVQGLAFGADVPVVGVGTLLAMAHGSGAHRVVCCIDARMQEVYFGAYTRERGELHALHEPIVCAPGDARALPGAGWTGCGSGFSAYGDALAARYAGQLAAVEPDRHPRARDIAVLAAEKVRAGLAVGAEHAAPVYIRDKVALTSDERAAR
ncbi:MAG TPA: tRNA (adenosine(37)-N6)-threonylcarbamoyltransferase complex dimerization subunit type 1 TsaB [Burkholderiales bacterium]|nr:tRNA (adenosine(37)-N6)-threonylcarbamoyltransferase complex dimerization subunit type 1 TsaB [Burkholderiales bacterium]